MKQRHYDNTCWRPALRDGESVRVILEIDRNDLLNWLGEKALQSKGGKSQVCSGAIRVRVENAELILWLIGTQFFATCIVLGAMSFFFQHFKP